MDEQTLKKKTVMLTCFIFAGPDRVALGPYLGPLTKWVSGQNAPVSTLFSPLCGPVFNVAWILSRCVFFE